VSFCVLFVCICVLYCTVLYCTVLYCTVLLPPAGNPIAVKYITSYKILSNFLLSILTRYAEEIVGHQIYIYIYIQGVQLKSGSILIRVIYLLRFTTCYITQLTCIYSKCWKWCPFISMHLSTRFAMFLATFLSVLSFFNNFRNSTFYWRLPSKFFKDTLPTVGVRHRF